MSKELDSIINDDAAAPAAPVAGRTRRKVEAAPSAGIELGVNGSFAATYNGFTEVESKFKQKNVDAAGNITYSVKMNKLFKFTLLEPAKLTQISKDEDGEKVKTKVDMSAEDSISLFGKGNLGYLLSSVAAGTDVEIVRLADDTMKKGEFKGQPVQSYEVFELEA